jgi:hypothetical protein
MGHRLKLKEIVSVDIYYGTECLYSETFENYFSKKDDLKNYLKTKIPSNYFNKLKELEFHIDSFSCSDSGTL